MQPTDPIYSVLYRYTKALSVALGYRDPLTRLHSERVLKLCVAVGVSLGLAEQEMGALKVGATFHDMGKIGIPDYILLKPAQFDDVEWEIMKQHSVIGAEILASTELEGSEQASLAIRHHHEHFDGGGYPDGLAGEEIPIHSRIISIADGYDAMAITRSYHHARTHTEVMAMLHKDTGVKYDPQLMQTFCEVIEVSPFRAA